MKQSTLVAIVVLLLAVVAIVIFINILQSDSANQSAQTMNESATTSEVAATPSVPYQTIAPNVSMAPMGHASAVLQWGGQLIFVDPVGDAATYLAYGDPDLIFITHRHGDHFDKENLPGMIKDRTLIVTNQDVADQLPAEITSPVQVVAPMEEVLYGPIKLQTIPAYNLREEAQQYHPADRGDLGLIFSDADSRIYFSGDTEGIPEMLTLEDIDVAFVAMNLPYTMDVDAAAEAVLSFAPATVYPYHFRTPEGFSDVARFESLVTEGNENIEVVVLDWYANEDETEE